MKVFDLESNSLRELNATLNEQKSDKIMFVKFAYSIFSRSID